MGYFNRFIDTQDDEDTDDSFEQLTFDDFMNGIDEAGDDVSISDIDKMITRLQAAKKQREEEELARKQAEEARLKAEEEARREAERIRAQQEAEAMRIALEEEQKQEAARHVEEVTSMDLDLGWENFYDTDESTVGVEATSISDGLIKSLNNLGCVDIEYISSITKEDYKTVIETLKGSIYQNPATWGECFFMGWETKEEYVSGNIRKKLDEAIQSNLDYNGYFSANVEVLTKALPRVASYKDIYITLGSPWVPTQIISDFINYILYPNGKPSYYVPGHRVLHDELTGTWEYDFNLGFWEKQGYASEYSTKSRNAFDILLRTLNMQSVAVYDTKKSTMTKSGKISVLNKEETVHAIEKQRLLIEKFREWVWADEGRRRELTDIYEDRYMNVKVRQFSGEFLEFPTMSPDVKLYSYQKDAVARILFTPNTLLAHDVGSGKTYIMAAAGMELKRMKLSDKNLYVVPNNIVSQWRSIFLEMYPQAEILSIEPKDFTKDKRKAALEKIRDKNYDAVIIAYSCFSQIEISREAKINLVNLELKKLEESGDERGRKTRRTRTKIDKLKDILSESYCRLINNGAPINMMPSVMLWGPPGVGKSQGVKQIAKRIENQTGKKAVVTDVRLLLFNPIDLRGIPTANEDKTLAIWLKPHIFQMDDSSDVVNILFLDEISAAPQSVQAAAYQITLDRVVGEHKLPDNCIVIAAGNRTTDKSVAYKMPKALANRLLHFDVAVNFNAWKKWAIGAGVNDKVVGFLSFRQDALMQFEAGTNDLAFPTPRSWEMVSNILNNINDDVDEVFMLIAGLVGIEIASEMRTWVKVYKDLPSMEDVFGGRAGNIPKQPDSLYALTSAMVSYARAHKDDLEGIRNSISYASKLPPDFSVVLLKDYMTIEDDFTKKLMRIPEFARWMETRGSLLNGSI